MCASESRPSLNATIANLRAPMPLGKKLRMMARNYWLRIAKRQDCCGHPGEPGC